MKRLIWIAVFMALCGSSQSLAGPADEFCRETWVDASGMDGKGGVQASIDPSGKRVLPLRPGSCPIQIDDPTLNENPSWLVYRGSPKDRCLSYEFTWVTQGSEKFWGKMWSGGGIAFNSSWAPVDVSKARYLILYAKTDSPDTDLDLQIGLSSTNKSLSESGKISMKQNTDNKRIGADWTRVVIPLSLIPNLSGCDLTQVNTVVFGLTGNTYPENKPLFVRFDNIYFSAADRITPVEKLGYLKEPTRILVAWDKTTREALDHFVVRVDGKIQATTGPEERQVALSPTLFAKGVPATVTVSCQQQSKETAPATLLIPRGPAAEKSASVTFSPEPGIEISPLIFGSSFASEEALKDAGITANRWGGNWTSTYNWKRDAGNSGADWYYLNSYQFKPLDMPENQKQYYPVIHSALANGRTACLTIPLLPWIAKPISKEGERLSSFPLSLYPDQNSNDGQGAGDGLKAGTKEQIRGNDPAYNYVPNSVAYQKEWVQTLVKDFGPASKGGIQVYLMDNEPGLWMSSHRDVFTKPMGYEDLFALNRDYATMVKTVDPSAKVGGLCSWGVMELADSTYDYDKGKEIRPDRKKHGDLPQVAWFLQQFKKEEQKTGKRLLDILSFHWYPEIYETNAKGQTVRLSENLAYEPELAQKQFEALREFWDPTYDNPYSWTNNPGNRDLMWRPFHPLLPKMKKFIQEYYPGTKLLMGEFSTGSQGYYHGCLLRAVALGLFAQEGLDIATQWGDENVKPDNFIYWIYKLYNNYNGKGGAFRGRFVKSASNTKDLYSFTAVDGAKWNVVLVNRNSQEDLVTELRFPRPVTNPQSILLCESLGRRLTELPPVKAEQQVVRVRVPAFSVLLVTAEAKTPQPTKP